MKKKTLAILVALLLLAGTGVYTYARYKTPITGTGTADIAKWAVSLKQNGNVVSNDFNLELNLDSNENIANGKWAPGRTATAELELDLTNTEVAVDYELTLDDSNLPVGMEITAVKATVGTNEATTLTKNDGKYTGELTLAQVSSDKTVTFEISVAWTNDDVNNTTTDTETGINDIDVTIPVTVVAQQHIG